MSELEQFRARIGALDHELCAILDRRFAVVREVGAYKKQHDVPVLQAGREVTVRERYRAGAQSIGVTESFGDSLISLILQEARRIEEDLTRSS